MSGLERVIGVWSLVVCVGVLGACSGGGGSSAVSEAPAVEREADAVPEVDEGRAIAEVGEFRAALPGSDAELTTIAFGSCAHEEEPQPIWESVLASDPELFLFIGDNVYADVWYDEAGDRQYGAPTQEIMTAAYEELGARPEWRRFRASCPVMATWDDHDFGLNDAGKEWALKGEAQTLMLDFFGVPEDSPRRDREGVYSARTFGPEGRRVQVILLDTRFFRDELDRRAERVQGRGPYLPSADAGKTMLGGAQWSWLRERLEEPADVRIIGSSIQVVAYEHGWETWGNLPFERDRLYGLIEETGANGVVFISGDRHLMEISRDVEAGPYPMWDFTSSGMNMGESEVNEPNRFRVGPVLRESNFGVIRIDWDRGEITLDGRGGEGRALMSEVVPMSELRVRR